MNSFLRVACDVPPPPAVREVLHATLMTVIHGQAKQEASQTGWMWLPCQQLCDAKLESTLVLGSVLLHNG